mmetsp:Transcript_43893/g.95910  ORF Transcript_43893/g.95910 Transcript_43893/m.95910 type:complete len:205 (+) Transcript_43893:389-1003(+)
MCPCMHRHPPSMLDPSKDTPVVGLLNPAARKPESFHRKRLAKLSHIGTPLSTVHAACRLMLMRMRMLPRNAASRRCPPSSCTRTRRKCTSSLAHQRRSCAKQFLSLRERRANWAANTYIDLLSCTLCLFYAVLVTRAKSSFFAGHKDTAPPPRLPKASQLRCGDAFEEPPVFGNTPTYRSKDTSTSQHRHPFTHHADKYAYTLF